MEPLCIEVYKHKLSHLKFNDNIHSKEQDVKTGFLFALSIAGHEIESKYKIKMHLIKFLDLLLTKSNIHMEFKNVPILDLIGYKKNEN